MAKETLILNEKQAAQKIERMAYEIWENNSREKDLVIAGIAKRGYQLAEILTNKLQEISSISVILVRIRVNKKDPLKDSPQIDTDSSKIEGKAVIVVDDVLNSGRTLMHALTPFLNFNVKTLSVATLLNRSYRNFPVQAKYVGTSLSTTLHEEIQVRFKESGEITAYLK